MNITLADLSDEILLKIFDISTLPAVVIINKGFRKQFLETLYETTPITRWEIAEEIKSGGSVILFAQPF